VDFFLCFSRLFLPYKKAKFSAAYIVTSSIDSASPKRMEKVVLDVPGQRWLFIRPDPHEPIGGERADS
jgi:hypothetical protein